MWYLVMWYIINIYTNFELSLHIQNYKHDDPSDKVKASTTYTRGIKLMNTYDTLNYVISHYPAIDVAQKK
jgi:hypothetical protein